MTDRRGRNNGYPTRRPRDIQGGGGSFRPPRRAVPPPITPEERERRAWIGNSGLPYIPTPNDILGLLLNGTPINPPSWWNNRTRSPRGGSFGGGGASMRWDPIRRQPRLMRDYQDLIESPLPTLRDPMNYPCLPTPYFTPVDPGEGWDICGPHSYSLPICPTTGLPAQPAGTGIFSPGACIAAAVTGQVARTYTGIVGNSFYYFMNYVRCPGQGPQAVIYGGGRRRVTGPYRTPVFFQTWANCFQPVSPPPGPGSRPNPWPEGDDSREPSSEDDDGGGWDFPDYPTVPPFIPPIPIPPVVFVMPPRGPGRATRTPPRREPPARRVREPGKPKIPPGAWRLLRVMGDLSEAADLVGVLYQALPSKARHDCRRRGLSGTTSPTDALACLFIHSTQIDLETAIRGYIKNQIEDIIYSLPGRLAGRASRRIRESIGSSNRTGVEFGNGFRQYVERGIQQEARARAKEGFAPEQGWNVSDLIDSVADPVLDELATAIARTRRDYGV